MPKITFKNPHGPTSTGPLTVDAKRGLSILDVVYEAGYFDQPHLTRSLKYYIGQTPAQIMDRSRSQQLSFLYKTAPLR